MKFCDIDGYAGSTVLQTLDFIAGYPAAEGMLTYDIQAVMGNKRGLGRVKCFAYSIAHLLAIPTSAVIAVVRIVATPIFFAILIKKTESKDRLWAVKYPSVQWLNECTSVITSPLWNVAGVIRAACGIIEPSLYLKDSCSLELSDTQREQLIAFFNQNLSPSTK